MAKTWTKLGLEAVSINQSKRYLYSTFYNKKATQSALQVETNTY